MMLLKNCQRLFENLAKMAKFRQIWSHSVLLDTGERTFFPGFVSYLFITPARFNLAQSLKRLSIKNDHSVWCMMLNIRACFYSLPLDFVSNLLLI